MKPLHIGITTFNCYDLLKIMMDSLRKSTLQPDTIHIIDNGNNPEALEEAIAGHFVHVVDTLDLIEYGQNRLSLAQSLNWFCKNLEEERVILHDDVILAPDSLQKLVNTPGPYVLDSAKGCIIMRDEVLSRVGFLDETISPGYYMYEDCDYQHRMALEGIYPAFPDCGVIHRPSATFRRTQMDGKALEDHHRRFALAEANYLKKWGKMPELGPNGLTV